jgi:energy-coupling factor transporter ATP-binding protein EcfA2
LQIEKLRARNIFELSGRKKQKIAFASVYAMNPEICLLDEPSLIMGFPATLSATLISFKSA